MYTPLSFIVNHQLHSEANGNSNITYACQHQIKKNTKTLLHWLSKAPTLLPCSVQGDPPSKKKLLHRQLRSSCHSQQQLQRQFSGITKTASIQKTRLLMTSPMLKMAPTQTGSSSINVGKGLSDEPVKLSNTYTVNS